MRTEPFADLEPEVITRMTERQVLDLLHRRYSQISQGDSIRYACAEHVAAHTGWKNPQGEWADPRRADFLAQDCWNAQGLLLHGHEVKVSRSDWLCELRDPSKAEAVKRYCDRWWLVVSDKAIVRDDLPDGWGLMAPGRTVACASSSERPRSPPSLTLPRSVRHSCARSPRRGCAEAPRSRTATPRDPLRDPARRGLHRRGRGRAGRAPPLAADRRRPPRDRRRARATDRRGGHVSYPHQISTSDRVAVLAAMHSAPTTT